MTQVEPDDLIRGILPSLSWSSGSRLPETARVKLTLDTIRASRVPAGVHLAFTGDASAVDVALETGVPTTVPAPTVPDAFVATARGAEPVVVDVPEGADTVRIPLPARAADAPVRVYLPEAREISIRAVTPVGGGIHPLARGPLWVVYGDSIAQGWSVSRPGLAWPSLVADELGLDLVNLGFAGSARGELLAADVVGASAADVVALAWGTNAWSSLSTDAGEIAQRMRLFLTTVRQGMPDAPIVVVSPLVRPDAEQKANRYGTTHAQLRDALEGAVRAFVDEARDVRIALVGGLDLVPAELLADGLHPDDRGHARFAERLLPHVRAAVASAGDSPVAEGGPR
ncbi:MAG: SGNH/GDSL hydrolase family protein [Microbacterium sp.]